MSTNHLYALLFWSAMHPLSIGLAVAVLKLTDIVARDGLDVVATGFLVYAGAALAALAAVLARPSSRAALWRLTRSQIQGMLAAAIVNFVYAGMFWIAVFGVAPIAALAAGPLRVPLEVFFGVAVHRFETSRLHQAAMATAVCSART